MLNIKNRFVLLSILFLIGLFILHFTANMFRNLNHDEHVYIASAVYWLQHGALPYRDFAHVHLPNLMFIYGLLYMVTDYHLLAARLFSVFCGWALLVIVYLLPFRLWRNYATSARLSLAICITAILFLSSIFAYTSGRAWNHDLPALLVVAAILIQGYALRLGTRHRWLIASGFFWSFAVCTRLSVGPALLAFFAIIWWTQEEMESRIRLIGYFLFGAIWPSLPTLYIFIQATDAFIFYNLLSHYLNTDYLLLVNPALDTSFVSKISDFIHNVLYNRVGNMTLFIGYFIVTLWAFIKGQDFKKFPEVPLIALVILSLSIGAFAPTPVFPQYFYILFPLFTIGILYGLRSQYVASTLNTYIRLPFACVTIILALLSIPRFEHAHEFLLPQEWLTVKVHKTGEVVADLLQQEGRVLTVAPTLPLEGSLDIYPALVAGPFALRAADALPRDARAEYNLAEYNLIGIDQLDSWLEADKPAAIYLNGQNDDAIHERALADYAQRNHYVALPLKRQETLWMRPMAQWEDTIQLISYQWANAPDLLQGGDELTLTLFLQAIAPIDRNLTILVKLIDAEGNVALQTGTWPWGKPTSTWQINDIWYDGHTMKLPSDLASGLYRVDIAFYDELANRLWQPTSPLDLSMPNPAHVTLDSIIVGDWPATPTGDEQIKPAIVWENRAELIAAHLNPIELMQQSDELSLTLFWQTTEKIENNSTIFVHLVGPDGQLVAQRDQQPFNGFLPMTLWHPEQLLQDEYVLPLPDKMESGTYKLFVGMYDPISQQRLPIVASDQPDVYQITQFNVKPIE